MEDAMKRWMRPGAGLIAAAMLWGGTALAENKPGGCNKAGAQEKVEGRVTKIDPGQGKLTVLEADGKTHEFQASKETLQDYKEGDQIKAKLRAAPDCSK
jgi:hypothetical protein